MSIKNLFNKIKNLPKKYIVAVAAGVVLAIPIIATAGYGPNRHVFNWNKPADRKGSLTGPVFNSFIHTPTYGNEFAFVDAKDSANTKPGGFADTVNVVDGKTYTVRAYIHNNANQSTNASGLGVAKNTKIRFKILPGVANGNEVTGYISADNAKPTVVYDTVKLQSKTKAFSLEYVPGSARIENNAHPYPGIALSNSIVGSGAAIGYRKMDGKYSGCFQYTSIVTIKVKIKMPKLLIDKGVSHAVSPKRDQLKETIKAKPGDTVTWRIDYKNTGTEVARDITIRDPLPKGLTLVHNSVTWVDINHQTGKILPDRALTSGGVNVGNYAPNGNGLIRFRTTINKNVIEKNICAIRNIAYGRAHDIPEMQNDARIVIENCNKPQPPIYSCDLLGVAKIGDKKYRYTVDATAENGANISFYMYDFGDGTEVLNTDKRVAEHTYAKAGDYLAIAKVRIVANGKRATVGSAECTKPISITPTTTPPTTPPATGGGKELVNTGPGDVLGIFTGTSLLGAFLHRKWSLRRGR